MIYDIKFKIISNILKISIDDIKKHKIRFYKLSKKYKKIIKYSFDELKLNRKTNVYLFDNILFILSNKYYYSDEDSNCNKIFYLYLTNIDEKKVKHSYGEYLIPKNKNIEILHCINNFVDKIYYLDENLFIINKYFLKNPKISDKYKYIKYIYDIHKYIHEYKIKKYFNVKKLNIQYDLTKTSIVKRGIIMTNNYYFSQNNWLIKKYSFNRYYKNYKIYIYLINKNDVYDNDKIYIFKGPLNVYYNYLFY